MLFYFSRLKFLHFCYFEGLKMDFLQLQYFQFTKTGFSPFKNFKNVIRRSEIVESCYFYGKKKKTSGDFSVTQKSGFYKFSAFWKILFWQIRGVNHFKFKFDGSFIQYKMLFYFSRLKSLHFCYFEGLKMDFLQLQYFQFTKTGFSPFKNFKNVIRRSEIVESCYFYEKKQKKPLQTFWWLRNQGFTNSQTIPVINTWDLFTF